MNGLNGEDLLVIVAHPDDEVLWLAPVLRGASAIVMCLPGHAVDDTLAAARRRAITEYPLANLQMLDLETAGVYRQSDPLRRIPLDHGIELLQSCPPERAAHYRNNYVWLLERLQPYVSAHRTVMTHNPWGEYGHEEHVQVNHAVTELARRAGSSVWAWEGFSAAWQVEEGVRLRLDHYPDSALETLPRMDLEVDLDLYRTIRDCYIRAGAWTWAAEYLPPNPSRYVQLVRDGIDLLGPAPSTESAPPHAPARRAGAL